MLATQDSQSLTAEILQKYQSEAQKNIHEYSEGALELLTAIEWREITPDNCDISIQIPSYYMERNLKKTILHYSQQEFVDKKPVVELIININWPSLEAIESSEAIRDVREAITQYPHLNICIVKQVVEQKDFKIGQVRWVTALTSFVRALENPQVDVDKMIVLTNDADLWGLSPHYLGAIYEYFQENPEVQAAWTFIDYPEQQVSSNHLGIIVQRCEEMLEIIDKKKFGHLILRSGSSAYRLSALFQAWTFPKARKWESGQVVRNIRKKYWAKAIRLIPKHRAKLITSARRHATAVVSGIPITDRYITFGTPEDLSVLYHANDSLNRARDTIVIAQDEDFIKRLSSELQSLYNKRIKGKKREYAMGNEASVEEEEIDIDVLLGLKTEVQEDFTKIAPFLGVKFDFPDEDTLRVTNIDIAKDNLRAKFGVFD